MREIPTTVGLVVCSLSGRCKRIRNALAENGRYFPSTFECRLKERVVGILLMDLARPQSRDGYYPVAWPDFIGYNKQDDLLFFVDDKWFLLEAHLKGGISKDLWKAIEDL